MMKTVNRRDVGLLKRLALRNFLVATSAFGIASVSSVSFAQEEEAGPVFEEIVVTGIRSSLQSALNEKRMSANLKEVIIAEDIGKLPDQNLAEVLENVTGIQITRTAGVGTGVQIRGTNSNRVEINGASSTGSGSGRSGISFEDINPAIIAAVEVTKSPDAKTIEGSVGGTVNLRTIRPLDLKETLGSIAIKGEDSSLSSESIKPRISAAWGDNWSTNNGEFGVVITGSYTEQEAVSFRPRTDRDNLSSVDGGPQNFQGIQFLLQEQENDDYETTNLSTSLEWRPNDNLKLFFDGTFIDQERSRDQYRLQASGVSSVRNIQAPTSFETVNYPYGIGSLQAALTGTIEPDLANDDDDPNLRFSSETNSRVTDTSLIRLGAKYQINDRLGSKFEYSLSTSDTATPNLSTTLNFINPNCPLDGTSNDNCVPFVYDLSGGSLAFGVNYNSPFAPNPQDLLNPANVVLDQVVVERNTTENEEEALRADFTYDLDWNALTSVDFGVRLSESSHKFEDIGDNIGGFSRMVDSPNGTLFAELLVPGPTNYNAADGRSLYIQNFLLLDPDRSFSDPQGVIDILQAAVIAHDPSSPDILNIRSDQNSFRDINEETDALYAQVNFEHGIFRGNFGVRYIDTTVTSVGFGPEDGSGNRSLTSTTGSYDFVLPRLNLVVQPREDLLIRFGYGSDINRPGFNRLATGFSLDTSENAAVTLGNPGLEPEEVDGWDLGLEWYFAPAAVASIGYFSKDRTNIFGQDFRGALLIADPNSVSGFSRETDPSCPGGGIYNPIVVPNVLGDPNTTGLCVDFTQPGNDPETTTQSGIELAFQYDLSSFEDKLGWASGFGLIANYTTQDFKGGSVVDTTSGRGLAVLGDVSIPRGLLDFSEDAYNFTVFYEKYGLSARMRYTWRESFRTNDFGGGANTSGSSTLSFPVETADRGQLNAAINYDIGENWNVGVEVTNLTEEKIDQHCVAVGGPLCFVGYPDRRITFGASYSF